MMKNKEFRAMLLAFALMALPTIAAAENASQATVTELKGEAKFLKSGTAEWRPLEKGAVLSEGDAIKTARESQVQLLLTGSTKTAELTVRPESEFLFKTFRHEAQTDSTLLDVQLGGVLVKAEKLVGDSKFEVKTPTSIVGIRGTTFEVQVSKT